MIIHGDTPPLKDVRADVPAGLEAIIAKCLQKDRTRRYANVGELAQALLEFAPERSRVSVERVLHLTSMQAPVAETMPARRAARRSSAPEIVALTPAIETNSGWGQTARGSRQRSRRGLRVALALGVVGLAAFAAFRFNLIARSSQSASTPSAPTSISVAAAPPGEPPKSEPPAEPAKAQPPASPSRPALDPASESDISKPSLSTSTSLPPHGPTKPRAKPPAAGQTPIKTAEPPSGRWEEQRK
jgi:serine/threonine-protein kinase